MTEDDDMELARRRVTRARGTADGWVSPPVAPVLVAALVLGLAYLVAPSEDAQGAVYLLGVWGASGVAWWGVRRAGRSLVTVLMATAVTAAAVGDTLWAVVLLSVGFDARPPVSVADLFYIPMFVALAAALLLVVARGRQTGRWKPEALIDALTLVTVSVMLMWMLSVAKIVENESASLGVRAVWAAYPVADAIVLALAVRALGARMTRTVPGFALLGGVLCWLASDLGFLFLQLGARTARVLDVGWLVGALLLALAPWGGRAPELAPVTRRGDSDGRVRFRVFVAILPLLVPPVLEIVTDIREHEATSWVAVGGMAVLLALAFARTGRLIRSEQALRAEVRASERRSAALAANSSDALVVTDATGQILRDSPQLAHLVRRDLTGAVELSALIPAAQREQLGDAMRHVLQHPEIIATSEFSVTGDDGRVHWVTARLVNLLEDPDVGGVVFALSDVTTRKEMEQALERSRDAALEASRAKSAFLANMSHEIRTPMNGVIGLTQLLLTTPLGARQLQYAQGIQGAGNALLSIIDDILDFSKVEAGKLVLETIDFDLSTVVEDVGELVAESATAKRLELLAYCSPEVPLALRGDPSRLRQVMLNLVSNAIKFTETGEVVLSAHLEESTDDGVVIRFEVADTGIGLDAERAEHLFAPFSQADTSTTRRYGGTGLGLAICRQLVDVMGGDLGVRSTPGHGSTFWFTVPLVPALEPTAAHAANHEGLAGVKVLVVDDNATSRVILCDQLGAWGMLPDSVPDGLAARERLHAAADTGAPYRLLVLDLCMPDVDGLDLARQVHSAPGIGPIGTVLLTSGPDVTPEEAHAAGIDQRLRKPVRLSHLDSTLREVLAATAPQAAPSVVREEATHRGHVLVVEDNEINQLVAVGILEHLGFTAEVVADGAGGVAAIGRSSFDAVLMDCQMPVMDGFEATAEIRRREGTTRHTPIIAMTAGAIEGDREACLVVGMDDYLAKPVGPDDLAAVLLRWVPTRVG